MSKTRRIVLAAIAAAAVAAAGAAAAAHRSQATKQVSATFAAGTVAGSHTSTCTSSDGTYQETVATYTGSATSSDARLNGTLRIRAHSVVNTTTGLGWLSGTFRINGSSGGAHGAITGVVSGGNVSGTAAGEMGGPEGKLLATVAASFAPQAGFSSGSLGSGTVSGAGVVFQRGTCTKPGKSARSTYVAGLRFAANQVVPAVTTEGKATGTFTLDVTRDTSGTITGANAVFYVNYRFDGPVTITGLTLNKGARGSSGPVVLDSGTATTVDTDGSGNITKVVSGVDASLVKDLLADPRGYYVQLSTADGGLRAQLGGFARHS
jgi:hypothetical protein